MVRRTERGKVTAEKMVRELGYFIKNEYYIRISAN